MSWGEHKEYMDEIERLKRELAEAKAALSQAMIAESLATGHGDTIGDLIRELSVGLRERDAYSMRQRDIIRTVLQHLAEGDGLPDIGWCVKRLRAALSENPAQEADHG